MTDPHPIKISINALGGQGGGVLAGWIVMAAERAGFIAQMTSVPGVAQRTGATVYYLELFSEHAANAKGMPPILALTPVPGDVDVVLALEIMEAGRAITRGFVTGKTTLIASSHRVYAIAEKIHLGDGRQSAGDIIAVAQAAAHRLIIADMEAEAASAGAVISAVMFGALASSGALPIDRDAFEDAIQQSGRAIEANLAGFEKGFNAAAGAAPEAAPPAREEPDENSPAPAIRPLLERIRNEFPVSAQKMLREGLKKVVDFQDVRYGDHYLDRMAKISSVDKAQGGERDEYRLTEITAKHLALWMAFEDTIRVADLKTRASRFARFRKDVRADEGQIVHVSEYMHPRIEEICDLAPAWLGTTILATPALRNGLGVFFKNGRRIPVTKLRGFLLLSFLASLKFLRRASYRFKTEEARINDWLVKIEETARGDYALACEVAGLQRLIKGYGETHARGLANYAQLSALLDEVKQTPSPAQTLALLKTAALSDEDGAALAAAIGGLQPGARAA